MVPRFTVLARTRRNLEAAICEELQQTLHLHRETNPPLVEDEAPLLNTYMSRTEEKILFIELDEIRSQE
jgi:hypothetical protein